MSLLVHAVGAWFATQAANDRYPKPVAIGIAMLVSRLGAPTIALALAGYAVKRLNEEGAFDEIHEKLRPQRTIRSRR